MILYKNFESSTFEDKGVMDVGGKNPLVLHQPKKPGVNRVKTAGIFLNFLTIVAESCLIVIGCLVEVYLKFHF